MENKILVGSIPTARSSNLNVVVRFFWHPFSPGILLLTLSVLYDCMTLRKYGTIIPESGGR